MVLPTIMRTTEEALLSVPQSYREGSFGLGAGKLRTVFRIVLPSAVPGILSGVILATGRIVGETAALIYTAGTMAKVPNNLFASARTLSVHMYLLSNEGLHTNEAFATAVVLLITHAMTGLTVAFIGLFIALVTIITAPKHIHEIISKVDYKTLLFFIGLFVVVGGLEQTGILEIAANFIGKISGGNAMLMVAIIIWLSAFASAFVDNIPFAATMIPIIKALAATEGVSLSTLAWALSMGTDIGGSATPIGASANVVGTSVAAKAGHPIGWGMYCKKVVPATILVLVISTVGIFVRYF